MSGQESTPYSLQAAIAALIRREIAAFLALSLMFAVPLSCQQHDMMSLLDLEMQHDVLSFVHAHGTYSPSGVTVEAHLDMPSVSPVAAVLAALAGVMPTDYAVKRANLRGPLIIFETLLPEQAQPIPPDQPPRSL